MKLWWRFLRERLGTWLAGSSYGVLRGELNRCKVEGARLGLRLDQELVDREKILKSHDAAWEKKYREQQDLYVAAHTQQGETLDQLKGLLGRARVRLEKLEPLAVIVTDEVCPEWSEEQQAALNKFFTGELGTRLMEIWEWYGAHQAIVSSQQSAHTEHANGITVGMREILCRTRNLAAPVEEKNSPRDEALITRLEKRRHKAPAGFSHLAP